VVCDCDRRIIALHSGWPGSCHDQKVFSTMSLSEDPELYFSDGMFLYIFSFLHSNLSLTWSLLLR
jgi:hypothetical protein